MTAQGAAKVSGASVLLAALALAGTGCAASSSSTPAASPSASLRVSASVEAPSISPASPTAGAVYSVTAGAPTPTPVDTSTPVAISTPVATASPTTTSACLAFAATHTFLYLSGATKNADGSLAVTGKTATMVCGGPDDFHYNFGSATVTGHVLASATIEVLSSTLQDTPITLAKFPGYLATDQNVRVFIYAGPRAAITTLTEQFHP